MKKSFKLAVGQGLVIGVYFSAMALSFWYDNIPLLLHVNYVERVVRYGGNLVASGELKPGTVWAVFFSIVQAAFGLGQVRMHGVWRRV
jgi:hypothetical protein